DRKTAPVQDNHGCQHTRGSSRQHVEVEADEPLARAHSLTLLDMKLESLAAARHRVDPDMEQDLRPIFRAQRNRVSGSWDGTQLAVARRGKGAPGRVDGQPISEDAPGEDASRRLIQRGAPTCQRCNYNHPRCYSRS